MTTIFINGRFLTRPLRGVNRVAVELSAALISRIENGEDEVFKEVLILAPDCILDDEIPDKLRAKVRNIGRTRGVLWEQVTLPIAARNGLLFNPCNVGPLLCRNQLTLIHDAQTFTVPESYGMLFRLWYKIVLPILARRSLALATVSQSSRDELVRCGVFPPQKAIVIPNGADHICSVAADPRILRLHNLEPKSYFLTIGSLAPHKNLERALLAAKEAQMPLAIVGGPPANIFKSVDLPYYDAVVFLGRVADSELRALYENSCGLIFPSLKEGFGLPIIEAMYCECPVIASNIETISEITGDVTETFDPTDVTGMANQMIRLRNDPGFRRSRVLAGVERAREFTWEASADSLFNALKQLHQNVSE